MTIDNNVPFKWFLVYVVFLNFSLIIFSLFHVEQLITFECTYKHCTRLWSNATTGTWCSLYFKCSENSCLLRLLIKQNKAAYSIALAYTPLLVSWYHSTRVMYAVVICRNFEEYEITVQTVKLLCGEYSYVSCDATGLLFTGCSNRT